MKKSLAIFLLLLYLLSLPGGFFAAGVGKAVVIAAPGAYDEDVRLDKIEGKKARAQYEEEIRTWDPLQAYEPAGGEADGGGVIAGLKGKIGELLEKLWKKGEEIAAKVWGWLKGAAFDARAWVKEKAFGAWVWFKGKAAGAWNWFVEKASWLWQKAKELAQKIEGWFKSLPDPVRVGLTMLLAGLVAAAVLLLAGVGAIVAAACGVVAALGVLGYRLLVGGEDFQFLPGLLIGVLMGIFAFFFWAGDVFAVLGSLLSRGGALAWRLLQRGVVAAWGFLRREVLARIFRERVIKYVLLSSIYSIGGAIVDFSFWLKKNWKTLLSMRFKDGFLLSAKEFGKILWNNFSVNFLTKLLFAGRFLTSKITLALAGGLLQAVFGYLNSGSFWTFSDGFVDVGGGAVGALAGEWCAKKIFSGLSSNIKRWIDSITSSITGTYVKNLFEGAKEASLKPGVGKRVPVSHSSIDCHVQQNSSGGKR